MVVVFGGDKARLIYSTDAEERASRANSETRISFLFVPLRGNSSSARVAVIDSAARE